MERSRRTVLQQNTREEAALGHLLRLRYLHILHLQLNRDSAVAANPRQLHLAVRKRRFLLWFHDARARTIRGPQNGFCCVGPQAVTLPRPARQFIEEA